MKVKLIQKYINFYLHKLITQNAVWHRYTNSLLFLGVNEKATCNLLAGAIIEVCING